MSNIAKRLGLRLSPSDHRQLAQLLDDFEILLELVGPACGARALDQALAVKDDIWTVYVTAACNAPVWDGLAESTRWTALEARNRLRYWVGEPVVAALPRRILLPFTDVERQVVANSLAEIERRLAQVGADRCRRKAATLRRTVDRARVTNRGAAA